VTEASKECPMCGESMRQVPRVEVIQIPGTAEVIQRRVLEWVCRECDYFELVGSVDEDESR
jgi:C4-type Zn-finger protein